MNRIQSILSDLGLVGFLAINLITIFLIIINPEYLSFNLTFLAFVYCILIISYFTSTVTSIVINIVTVFVYITAIIYLYFTVGLELHFYMYYWLVVTPLFSTFLMIFRQNTYKIQSENEKLKSENEFLIMLDEETGLENIRSFYTQSKVYFNLAKRYQLPLTVMVIELKYQNEVIQIVGRNRFKSVLKELSQHIDSQLRCEDYLFIVDKSPYRVVTLLLSDKKGSDVVKKRLKESVKDYKFMNAFEPYNLKLEVKIGCSDQVNDESTILDYLNQAIQELDYDVV